MRKVAYVFEDGTKTYSHEERVAHGGSAKIVLEDVIEAKPTQSAIRAKCLEVFGVVTPDTVAKVKAMM